MWISFRWDSSLSEERQSEIITWVKSLTPEQQDMLSDLLDDRYESGQFSTLED